MQIAGLSEPLTQLQSELQRSAAEAEKRLTDMQTLEAERDSLSDKLKTVRDEVNV